MPSGNFICYYLRVDGKVLTRTRKKLVEGKTKFSRMIGIPNPVIKFFISFGDWLFTLLYIFYYFLSVEVARSHCIRFKQDRHVKYFYSLTDQCKSLLTVYLPVFSFLKLFISCKWRCVPWKKKRYLLIFLII